MLIDCSRSKRCRKVIFPGVASGERSRVCELASLFPLQSQQTLNALGLTRVEIPSYFTTADVVTLPLRCASFRGSKSQEKTQEELYLASDTDPQVESSSVRSQTCLGHA